MPFRSVKFKKDYITFISVLDNFTQYLKKNLRRLKIILRTRILICIFTQNVFF